MNYGWRLLPFSLKILFVWLAVDVLLSLFIFAALGGSSYQLLGLSLSGAWALLATSILNIISALVFLVCLYHRYSWTWIYGIFYFLFFIINGGISLFVYPNINYDVLVGIALYAFFLLVIVLKRDYFKN